MNERLLVMLSTNPAATWFIKHVASHLDPLVFKASNGRFTFMGPAVMPMLTMTAIGRRSGRPQAVQLACFEHAGDQLVVASSMGQEKHPAWRYNLEANPEVEIQMRGERFSARAQVLTDAEKDALWPDIRQAIPQMKVYEKRTRRNIRVFRLSRIGSEPGAGGAGSSREHRPTGREIRE